MPDQVEMRACRKLDGAGLDGIPIRGMRARDGRASGGSSLQGREEDTRVPGVARLLGKGLDEKGSSFNRLHLRAGSDGPSSSLE